VSRFAHRPNGWTVAFLLKALGLSYETKYLDFAKGEQKAEEFLKLNPNVSRQTFVRQFRRC